MFLAGGEALTAPMGYGWALVKMIAALAIVCAIAYVALRFGLRRFVAPSSSGRAMRIVDRCALSPGRALWIVEAGGRTFMLGATDGGITLLSELDAATLPAPLDRSAPRAFAEILSRGKSPVRSPADPPAGDDSP